MPDPAPVAGASRRQVNSAIGIIVGVVAGALLYLLLRETLPPAASPGVARLWLLIGPAVLLFVMVIAVGNGRFVSGAADPLARQETRFVQVGNRVLRNTVEQTLIFVLAGLAVLDLERETARVVLPAVASLFVIGRLAFWIGYLIDPLWRAPGMALTMLVNACMLVWIALALLR